MVSPVGISRLVADGPDSVRCVSLAIAITCGCGAAQGPRLARLDSTMATVCVHMHLIYTMPLYFGDFHLQSVILTVA